MTGLITLGVIDPSFPDPIEVVEGLIGILEEIEDIGEDC